MTEVPDFPGFSYFPHKRPGFYKVCWRENRGQRSRKAEGFTGVMKLVLEIAPRLLNQRIRKSDLLPSPIILEMELGAYAVRMSRARRTPDSQHAVRTVRVLKKFFDEQRWVTAADITPEKLDHYRSTTKDTPMSQAKRIDATLVFLRRTEEKYRGQISQGILSYDFVRPESGHTYSPWSEEEDRQYFSYLVSGMEVLAAADPTLCWSERIDRVCHTANFRTRMHLICFYMLLSRHLTRPKELTCMKVKDWNSRRKALSLEWDAGKATTKVSLCDDEVAWLLDVVTLNRLPDEPLFLSPAGEEWDPNRLSKVTSKYTKLAGLVGRTNYEIKYTAAGRMYDNPDDFTAVDHERRLNRVRAISGHSAESKAVERYIKSRWGTEFGLGALVYYNKRRVFPFRIEDFPPRKIEEPPEAGGMLVAAGQP